MHGHMGEWHSIWFPRARTTDMIRSMDGANVKLLCFAPHASLFAPQIGNTAAIEAVRRFPTRLRAYLSVNPHYGDQLQHDLGEFDGLRDVYIGLKLLADYHAVPLTDERYRPAWEFANQRRLPVLSHTWGGSTFNGPHELRRIAAQYPDVKLFLGHCLNDHWHEAAALCADFPNLYCELTSVLGIRGVLEYFVEKVGSRRMLFGTDLPWFDEHHGIGSVLAADMSDADRHNILHRNAEKILRDAGVNLEL